MTLRFLAALLPTILFLLIGLAARAQDAEPQLLRVAVSVKAKEINTHHEIVQLPADNLPKIAYLSRSKKHKNYSKAILPRTEVANSPSTASTTRSKSPIPTETRKSTAKQPIVASNKTEPIKPTAKNSPARPAQKQKVDNATKQQIAKQAPIVAKPSSTPSPKTPAKEQVPTSSQAQNNKQNTASTNPTTATNNSNQTIAATNKVAVPKPANNTTTKAVTTSNTKQQSSKGAFEQDQQTTQVDSSNSALDTYTKLDSHVQEANQFNYIWIGVFLIITGIVFGLLFGKVAFLISAVGGVFVIIGFLVR